MVQSFSTLFRSQWFGRLVVHGKVVDVENMLKGFFHKKKHVQNVWVEKCPGGNIKHIRQGLR